MNDENLTSDDVSVTSQHETIMQGGKIEEFADALGRFCQNQGWKKLKDEHGEAFKSLRHYVEASPPFGAGYSGKAGMEKIEAYLSLNPRVKDYFQHCHASCLSEMAQEQGVSPAVVSKSEWSDVMGARLARVIKANPEQAYEEKAAAYVENKERVKPQAKFTNEYSPIRLSYRPSHTYAFAKKLKDSISSEELKLLLEALTMSELEELIEFEKFFNSALTAFNRSKSELGWSSAAIIAPAELAERSPKIQFSKWLEPEHENGHDLSLCDDEGEIVKVRISKLGGGAKALSFV